MKLVKFHIRRRLRRRGGNQFYRDNSVRESSTFCGAPCGDKDVAWNSKAETWTDRFGDVRMACERCVEVRNSEVNQHG